MAFAVTVPDTLEMIVGEQLNLAIDFTNLIAPGDTIQYTLNDQVYLDTGDFNSSPRPPTKLLGTRIDSVINQATPTFFGVSTNFSQHISGFIVPLYTETYTFYVTTDDGARLWVNGVKLVDSWINQGPTVYSGTIALTAGVSYPIVVDFYQGVGPSTLILTWQSPSQTIQIVPSSALAGGGFAIPIATVQNTSTNEMVPSAIIGVPYASNSVILNVTVSSLYLRPKTEYVLKLTAVATGGNGSKTVSAQLIVKVVY